MLKNAIVVMFDSLQRNYLGCYGNTWCRTPHMDRLAREGMVFDNCYTEGLPTVPCRHAMHTGRYTLPSSGWVPLSMQDTTIADLCWGRPIDTALVFDCPMYRLPKFGYTRGFDKVWFLHGHEGDEYYYEHDPLLHRNPDDYMDAGSKKAYTERTGEAGISGVMSEIANYLRQHQHWKSPEDRYVARTMRNAVRYLEQVDRNKQFYLWIDSFDPHEPWDAPSVYMGQASMYDPDYTGKEEFLPFSEVVEGIYSEEQLAHVRKLYAECVTTCDAFFGVLLDALRRLGFEENTLIMLVSDHGEPMGNGEHGHGIMRKCRPWPYEELVHTPMILRAPGIKPGQRCAAYVQSCDVAPTVCDWLGIGVHPDMQGKSLLPLARGETDKVRDFAVAGYHKYSWALYSDDWTYIHWVKTEMATSDVIAWYTESIDMSHLAAVGGKSASCGTAEAMTTSFTPDSPRGNSSFIHSEADERRKAAASLDGEAQWTCTPGSTADVPEVDELYHRPSDPFQLRNVAAEHPDVARAILLKLQNFMAAVKAS